MRKNIRFALWVILQENEFRKSVDSDGCDQVFIKREWEWLEDDNNSECQQSEGDQEESNLDATCADNDSDEDEDEIPAITHSVTFKYIGCTKELYYQETLALVKQKINKGENVQVKLQKELDNAFDANTIVFMCNANGNWKRIGYVGSEALPDINDALLKNKIVKGYFDFSLYTLRVLAGMQVLQLLKMVTGQAL